MLGFIADFMRSIHMNEQHHYKWRASISMTIIPKSFIILKDYLHQEASSPIFFYTKYSSLFSQIVREY